MVSSLRIRKDADEIAAMRKAVKVAQSALEATIPLIKIGMTEKELASELVIHLLQSGSQSRDAVRPDRLRRTEQRQPACQSHPTGRSSAVTCWWWIGVQQWMAISPT